MKKYQSVRDIYVSGPGFPDGIMFVNSIQEDAVFSWAIIHEIFLLTKRKETVGCFQARAIVSPKEDKHDKTLGQFQGPGVRKV